MAEILGAVAAGVALCTTLVESGKAIRKATERIKNAKKDVLELSDEAVLFAGLCEQFLHTCNDHTESTSKAFTSLNRLVAWLKEPEIALSDLLEKVKALIRDPRYQYSWQETCIAHVEWFGSKSAVKKLRASLRIARSSISGYSNLMCIQKLGEELRMLNDALRDRGSRRIIEERFKMTLERKIEMVLQSLDIKSSVHDTNKRTLRAAKEEIIQIWKGKQTSDLAYVPEDLIQFTESVGAYAKEVLPPMRQNRRSILSRASTSVSGSTYVHTPPSKRRFQDSGSHIPSNQANISHERRSRPGLATPKSVSTSSGIQLVPRPDTISSISSASRGIVERKIASGRKNEQTSPKPHAHNVFEIKDKKSREYINDPEGNILSPPKLKSSAKESHEPKMRRVGRHKMMLSATSFQINNHSYIVTKYPVADALFEALLRHRDKFDKLVEILDAGDEEEKWDGIPGWLADSRRITRLVENMDVEDVLGSDR